MIGRTSSWVLVLVVAFPCSAFGQSALEKLIAHREAFVQMFRKHGMLVRFELHVKGMEPRKEIWEEQRDGDYMVVRSLGRNTDDPFDDKIYVKGPQCMFLVQVVPGESGEEVYNLIDMVPAGTVLTEQSPLYSGLGGEPDATPRYPWQFEALTLEDMREKYEVFTVSEPNSEEIRVEFSGPIDKYVPGLIYNHMRVNDWGKLVFRADHDWMLAEAEWKCDLYDSNGKKTESFKGSRTYFSGDGEFGFGKFEGDEFIEGTDVLPDIKSTSSYGRRMTWEIADIDPAVFTPEHYGIDSALVVARRTNWWLWIGIAISVLAIATGVWLRRRSLAGV